jgi:hypothetical protein
MRETHGKEADMKISPDRKFVVVTFDPATPDLKVPVGKAGTIEAARKVLASLKARAGDWALEILAAPDWAPVEA